MAQLMLRKAWLQLRPQEPLPAMEDVNGRPALSTEGFLDFNFSHSGSMVACAVSSSLRIGLDLEEKRPLDLNNYVRTMGHEEWRTIRRHKHPSTLFLKNWTYKEALSKAMGKGLYHPFSTIEITYPTHEVEGEIYRMMPLELHHSVVAHLALHNADSSVLPELYGSKIRDLLPS